MVWGKLDECIGAGILGTIAMAALFLHFDGTVIGACVTGIVSLLITQSTRKKETAEAIGPLK